MISPNTYEEIYEILSLMDKVTVMKIPEEILSNISQKRNSKFKSKIDKNDIFNKENISEEAMDLLCYLDYNYWMDEDSKSQVDKIIRMNELQSEKEKREKFNPDFLFDNTKNNCNINTNTSNNHEKIAIYNKSVFEKIWNKILNIFKR